MVTINGNIVDVIKGEIFKGELKISDGKIISVEKKDNVSSQYIMPGLIDSHVHIESSMLTPIEFAKIVVRHGTVATISDPHEIANVLGEEGVYYMIRMAKNVPLKMFFGAPSCVPSTRFETSGSILNSAIIEKLMNLDDIYYLAEVMDYDGVLSGNKDLLAKIEAAKKSNKPIDGHAPALNKEKTAVYASMGITTDHECITIEEAYHKIKHGMKIQIREGSAAKNFENLNALISEYPDHVMLCTDDSHPDDLLNGHIDVFIRRGLKKGHSIFDLLKATVKNPINHYRINVGCLQPGDAADIVIVDNLVDFTIKSTWIDGIRVFDGEEISFKDVSNDEILNNFRRNKIQQPHINFPYLGKPIDVISIIDGELYTEWKKINPNHNSKWVISDIETDVLKILAVSRYNESSPVVGFIKNFGLKKGALASSISHDSHNIVAIGTNDNDILDAVNSIIEMKGGIVASLDGNNTCLPLEIAGLMSNSNCTTMADKYKKLNELAAEYGSTLHAPFMTMAFMTLLVIPEIKISDQGLFDVLNSKFIYKT